MAGKRYISLNSTPQAFRPLQRGIPAGLDPGLSASHFVPGAFLPSPGDFGMFAGCGFSNRSPWSRLGHLLLSAPGWEAAATAALACMRLNTPGLLRGTLRGLFLVRRCPHQGECWRLVSFNWTPPKKLDFNQDKCVLCHFWPDCHQAVVCLLPPETVARAGTSETPDPKTPLCLSVVTAASYRFSPFCLLSSWTRSARLCLGRSCLKTHYLHCAEHEGFAFITAPCV